MITFENYFIGTKAVFKGCKTPKRQPDYISISKSNFKPSSRYWYGEDRRGKYVIREADHWVSYKNFNLTFTGVLKKEYN